MFKRGDYVEKYTGDYQAKGYVLVKVFTMAGKLRYLVELDAGPIMIFNEGQLKFA